MNSKNTPFVLSRRCFLRRYAAPVAGASAVAATLRDLRLMNTLMAAQSPTGYKALVCLFMSGGNDANNLIVPTDTTPYNNYTAIRGNLAIAQADLKTLRTGPGGSDPAYQDADGHNYGFHPGCTKLQTLFGEKKLAVSMNIGTLLRPITRAQYLANATGTRPPQLFSHSDQVTEWQTSIPDQPPTTGWTGRVADLYDSVANPTGKISMSVSLGGANTIEIGNIVSQYQVSTSGAVTLSGNLMSGNTARVKAMKDIMALNHTNLQRTAYADVLENAIFVGDLLNTSIAATAESAQGGTWVWNTPFPTSSLGNQLKMIARLIQASGPTGFDMKRQVFFANTGGFDTHTSQVLVNGSSNPSGTTGAHYVLLNDISECMFAFQRAMEQIGFSDKVTTFTASDFSRTFPTNSQGSDHGWGGHHLIMGGAVDGGKTVGKLPTFALNGPDDTDTGRWIPTTSVDQHAATLAQWYGLDQNEIQAVLPNINRFSGSFAGKYLNFMKPA